MKEFNFTNGDAKYMYEEKINKLKQIKRCGTGIYNS